VPGLTDQWNQYNARFKALGSWVRNAATPFDITLSRGNEGKSLAKAWAEAQAGHICYADATHPFRLQGSADLNSYKMFCEFFWTLLRLGGRLGMILPTGIYSDFGTKDLRQELLERGRIDILYAFQNNVPLNCWFFALASIRDSSDNPFPATRKGGRYVAVPDGSIEGPRSGFGPPGS